MVNLADGQFDGDVDGAGSYGKFGDLGGNHVGGNVDHGEVGDDVHVLGGGHADDDVDDVDEGVGGLGADHVNADIGGGGWC